jgi:ribosomal-protein-alanine N-acetyltransferase
MQDLESFFALNSDPELMQYIRPPQSFEESKKFLEENLAFYESHPTLGRWALVNKSEDLVVGSLSLLPLEHSNDLHIGYVLFKPYWRQGYAAEIVRAGIIHAFDQLKLKTLTAVTYPENLPSQNVLLKNGFVLERSFVENGRESRLYRLNNAGPYLKPVS